MLFFFMLNNMNEIDQERTLELEKASAFTV